MKNYIFKISLLFFLISCKNEKNQNAEKIEVYRPIKPIASYLGEKLSKYPEIYNQLLNDSKGTTFIVDTSIIKIDPKNKRVYYADEYKSTEKDLPNEPFISSSEIEGINFETNEIVFTEEGSKKIRTIKHRVKYSNQFIITVNRKSVIDGYFVNSFTSQYVYGYIILYSPTIKGLNGKIIDHRNQKYFLEYYDKDNGFVKPNLKKNIELYKAFERTGKILK